MKKSLHILADFYNCRGNLKYLASRKPTEPKLKAIAKKAGFHVLGTLFHEFPGGGITGLILVSESHIAIHTWPERGYLTLDVFFCNYTRNNTIKVRQALQDLRAIYKPSKIVKREILRD